MEAEVQSLRRDNIRLQEESQTAAAQLRKFTEWFFQTIDRQWSSVTKHCSEKGNHSVKCKWSSSVIFYVIMFCYEVLKSMTHWDTWSLYPIVIKCVFQQERSINVSWVFIYINHVQPVCWIFYCGASILNIPLFCIISLSYMNS